MVCVALGVIYTLALGGCCASSAICASVWAHVGHGLSRWANEPSEGDGCQPLWCAEELGLEVESCAHTLGWAWWWMPVVDAVIPGFGR